MLALALTICVHTSDLSSLSDFLRRQPDPSTFVVDRFRSRDVVFLGEDHGVKENLDFLARLLPKLHEAGIHQLGVEFGAEEDQVAVDRLVLGETYDPVEARRLQFSYNVGWAVKEYQELYQAAWSINRNRKKGTPPFRIVHLSYVFDWSKFTGRHAASMRGVFRRGPIEHFRANVIEREAILPRRKMLVICGTPHAYTKYVPMTYNVLAADYLQPDRGWLGQLVEAKIPGRTATIMLHQPFYRPAPLYKPTHFCSGILEEAWERAGRRSVGIDLQRGPVGELQDSAALPIVESSDRGGLRLGDWADGYIILDQLKKLQGATLDREFVTESNLSSVQTNWPDPDWRAAPKSVEEFYRGTGDYLDLRKRYFGL